MRIIIDADACAKGAKNICIKIKNEFNLELIMVIDTAHELFGDFEVIKVDKGNDSVDLKIISICQKDDIIVTQDYGLASVILSKAKAILNPNGFRYTELNIERLMMQRYIGQKQRKAGKRTKGPAKRTIENDKNFEIELLKLVK